MSSRRHRPHPILPGVVALALWLVDAAHGASVGQSKLEARYVVTLSGLPVARGAWVIDISDDQFTAAASGATSGVMRVLTSGRGQSAVRGTLAAGQPVTSTYTSSIHTDKKYDEVRMVITSGTVKEFQADPPTLPSADRVPLAEAHRRGVSDPLSASLMRVPGSGDAFGPQACPRKISVFDGRMRYDLQLGFRRVEQVKAEKGYQGKAVVCSVRFSPIAGHVPDRYAIKYLSQLRDIEMWLAPITGTRLMVPFRVSIPTPLGVGVLQATHFVSTTQSAQASGSVQ